MVLPCNTKQMAACVQNGGDLVTRLFSDRFLRPTELVLHVQLIDEYVVRVVEHIANELVPHIEAVHEFVGRQIRVLDLDPELGLKGTDRLFRFLFGHFACDEERVEPAVEIARKYPRRHDKVESSRLLDEGEHGLRVDRRGGKEKRLERRKVGEVGIEGIAEHAALAGMVRHGFEEILAMDDLRAFENVELGARRAAHEPRTARDLFEAERALRVE